MNNLGKITRKLLAWVSIVGHFHSIGKLFATIFIVCVHLRSCMREMHWDKLLYRVLYYVILVIYTIILSSIYTESSYISLLFISKENQNLIIYIQLDRLNFKSTAVIVVVIINFGYAFHKIKILVEFSKAILLLSYPSNWKYIYYGLVDPKSKFNFSIIKFRGLHVILFFILKLCNATKWTPF